jgi:flagellar biosynthesis protein FliQ
MDHLIVTELVRAALLTAVTVMLPVLLAVFIVSLAASVLQTLTQLQDHTLSQVPRLIAGGAALFLLASWMFERLTDYTITLYEGVAASL